eukprot:2318345-Prymnesium_polylepis.1
MPRRIQRAPRVSEDEDVERQRLGSVEEHCREHGRRSKGFRAGQPLAAPPHHYPPFGVDMPCTPRLTPRG